MNKNTERIKASDKQKKEIKTDIDIRELYNFNAGDVKIDITITRYSNLAYVQVSPRDVQIDFLEMPGVKKDDKMNVNGTRIYMSHVSAQRLSEVLSGVLKQVHSRGEIEQLSFKENKN